MSEKELEKEIQAKGLTAPRITPADIEANIASEHYFTAAEAVNGHNEAVAQGASGNLDDQDDANALDLLTFCVLVLRNGYTVTGTSACASPENFDAEVGRKVARQNAVQQVWPLMGYALKERLAAVPTDFRDRVRQEHAELANNFYKLSKFMQTAAYDKLDAEDNRLLAEQHAWMSGLLGILDRRIARFK